MPVDPSNVGPVSPIEYSSHAPNACMINNNVDTNTKLKYVIVQVMAMWRCGCVDVSGMLHWKIVALVHLPEGAKGYLHYKKWRKKILGGSVTIH